MSTFILLISLLLAAPWLILRLRARRPRRAPLLQPASDLAARIDAMEAEFDLQEREFARERREIKRRLRQQQKSRAAALSPQPSTPPSSNPSPTREPHPNPTRDPHPNPTRKRGRTAQNLAKQKPTQPNPPQTLAEYEAARKLLPKLPPYEPSPLPTDDLLPALWLALQMTPSSQQILKPPPPPKRTFLRICLAPLQIAAKRAAAIVVKPILRASQFISRFFTRPKPPPPDSVTPPLQNRAA